MVALSPLAGAGWQFFSDNGVPLAGGKLYTYAAGTTTPLATYTSSTGATPHANPIVLDSAGRVPSEIWLTSSASYKFTLKTPANVEIWTKDNIPGISTAADLTAAIAAVYADLASHAAGKGASLIGLVQGGTVQNGIRQVTPDMEGAVPNVNSDGAMTTWSNANNYEALGGLAYQTTVTMFPQVQGQVIDGEGGTLTNTNTTNISVNDQPNITTMVGYTNFISDNQLTFYSIASVSGCVMTLTTPADGANFTVGDMVLVRGATYYTSAGYEVATYQTRARVEAVSGGTITLDRGLCEGLAADSPKIGTFAQGVNCGISGISPPQLAYIWYAPKLQNITLSSDQSNAIGGGGVIDGMFRNITTQGRNGWALNAMQDCLVDGLRFVGAWRKIVELAQGSSGTVIRNVRGTLLDGSTKRGGASDISPFGCSISENSEDCTFEDFDVSGGPNDFGAANSGVLMGSGRRNKVRNSTFNFPALTGYGLTIQNNPTAGNPNNDCVYENIILYLPVGNRFINIGDAGGSGVNRPTLRNIKAFGTVSSGRAVSIAGSTDGLMENCWFQDGALYQAVAFTGWTIRDNYIPDGFDATITDTTFANNNIFNNDSDANRLARAGALQFTDTTAATITTSTTANNVWKKAIFPAGSLTVGDSINFYADFSAAGATANARNIRVSVTDGAATTQGMGSASLVAAGSMLVQGRITILTNNLIRYESVVAGVTTYSQLAVSSISAGGLTINFEAWLQTNAGETILVGLAEILPRKRGMIQIPSKGRD